MHGVCTPNFVKSNCSRHSWQCQSPSGTQVSAGFMHDRCTSLSQDSQTRPSFASTIPHVLQGHDSYVSIVMVLFRFAGVGSNLPGRHIPLLKPLISRQVSRATSSDNSSSKLHEVVCDGMKVASSSHPTCSRQRIVSLLSSVEPRSDCEPSRGPPWRFPNARCVWCVFEVHEEVECRPLRAECVFWAMRSRVTAQVNLAPAKMLRQDRRGNFFERFWRQNHEKASQRSAHMALGARVALR